uniref:Ferritin n=1 Tax=Myotis lucifugus TaxID=59463 RepID=G1Q3B3_MYOLU
PIPASCPDLASCQPPHRALRQSQGPRHHSNAAQPPLLSTHHNDDRAHHAGGSELPPGLRGLINVELYVSSVCLSMSYYFGRDDVALKNLAKYFLRQPHEEREHAEKLTKLQTQRGGRIFLQDIKKPDHDNWENGLNAMECALDLGKGVNQSLLDWHKVATDKNDPHLCDFTETHYLNEQVKPIKELGDDVINLCWLGAPEIGTVEYLFDKHTQGDSAES